MTEAELAIQKARDAYHLAHDYEGDDPQIKRLVQCVELLGDAILHLAGAR